MLIGLLVGFSSVTQGVGPVTALVSGLWCGLAVGLSSGLVAALGTSPDERLALGQDAKRLLHNDLVSGLMFGLLVALAIGLVVGLPFGLSSGLASGVIAALMFGLPCVLVGVVFAAAAGRHAVACLLLGLAGTFPARPARFLEWARNAGLLRVTGIAYQFRHDTYGEWLAAGGSNRIMRSDAPADTQSY